MSARPPEAAPGTWQTCDVLEKGSRASQLLGLLAVGVAASLVSWWILAAYFNVSIPESISWFVRDGSCRPIQVDGMVPHCWQDYSQFIGLNGLMIGPDDNQFILNYPPISRLVFHMFEIVGNVTTAGVALSVFLLINLVGLLTPAIWATRGKSWEQRALVISLLGVATLPTLAALDRGNNLGLIVPALLFFLIALVQGRYQLAVVMIVVAAQFKPQFLVLVFALMAVRQWRRSMEALVGGATVFLVSFVVFGTQAVDQAYRFVEYLVKFNGYQPLDAGYPPNISFARFIQGAFATGTAALPNDLAATVMETWLRLRSPALLGIGFAVIAALVAIRFGRRIPVIMLGSMALVIAACFPGITNAYYSAVAMVVGALVISMNDLPGVGRKLGTLTIVAIALSLSLVVVPYGFMSIDSSTQVVAFSLIPILATGTWMAVIAATLFAAARREPVESSG